MRLAERCDWIRGIFGQRELRDESLSLGLSLYIYIYMSNYPISKFILYLSVSV